jgi:hypothetical protein
MRVCLGVAILMAGFVAASAPADRGPSQDDRKALLWNLSRFTAGTVRRALDLALSRLASPGCPRVYSDFELGGGGTPQDELDRLRMDPAEFLETLAFVDGSREPVCLMGLAALTTTPGSRVISVCPLFPRLQVNNPGLSASLIIHESLHALGLGENPPRSREITGAVERRCGRGAP